MRYLVIAFLLMMLPAPFPGSSALLAHDDRNTIEEKVEKQFSLEPGGSLKLENSIGEIRITGWDQPRVEIEAIKKVRYKDNPERARELLREIEIEVKQKDNSIRIESDVPDDLDLGGGWTLGKLIGLGRIARDEQFGGVDFRIKVPSNTNLKIELAVGEVDIVGVGGEVDVENSVGEVNLENLSGEIDVEASVGEIELHLPDGAGAVINASCSMGEIDCEIPLNVNKSMFGNSMSGKLNGGGPRISLAVSVGEIKIR